LVTAPLDFTVIPALIWIEGKAAVPGWIWLAPVLLALVVMASSPLATIAGRRSASAPGGDGSHGSPPHVRDPPLSELSLVRLFIAASDRSALDLRPDHDTAVGAEKRRVPRRGSFGQVGVDRT
jgi:hypothetical protein